MWFIARSGCILGWQRQDGVREASAEAAAVTHCRITGKKQVDEKRRRVWVPKSLWSCGCCSKEDSSGCELPTSRFGMGSRFELEVTQHRVVQNFYLVVEHGVRGKYENLILSKKQSSSVDPGVCVLVCACVCACTYMHTCDMKSCFFMYPYPIVT